MNEWQARRFVCCVTYELKPSSHDWAEDEMLRSSCKNANYGPACQFRVPK